MQGTDARLRHPRLSRRGKSLLSPPRSQEKSTLSLLAMMGRAAARNDTVPVPGPILYARQIPRLTPRASRLLCRSAAASMYQPRCMAHMSTPASRRAPSPKPCPPRTSRQLLRQQVHRTATRRPVEISSRARRWSGSLAVSKQAEVGTRPEVGCGLLPASGCSWVTCAAAPRRPRWSGRC